MQSAIKAGQITCKGVVEAYIERAKAYNGVCTALITEDGADEHIDALAKKYLDQDKYPFRTPDEVRVKYYIEPVKVATMG